MIRGIVMSDKPQCKCQQYKTALDVLLSAREIKETQGKTPEYEAKKELGWRLAKEVMGRK